jgi:hypothetical protein
MCNLVQLCTASMAIGCPYRANFCEEPNTSARSSAIARHSHSQRNSNRCAGQHGDRWYRTWGTVGVTSVVVATPLELKSSSLQRREQLMTDYTVRALTLLVLILLQIYSSRSSTSNLFEHFNGQTLLSFTVKLAVFFLLELLEEGFYFFWNRKTLEEY